MEQIFEKAAIELSKVTPSFVKNQCKNIAQLHYSSGVMGFIVNELIDNGSLIVPKEKTNLAIWGINHKQAKASADFRHSFFYSYRSIA